MGPVTTSERATGALAVAAATALVVALASPVATAVIGLILLGTLAVLLELRYLGVQLAWGLLVPAVVLAGAVDTWLTGEPGIARSVVGDGRSLVAAAALPGDASGVLGLRLLTVY